MYNPDGTTNELFSFYDEAEGSSANYKNMTDAFTELAGQSAGFRKSLRMLKNQCTYSNLNMDYGKIGGKKKYFVERKSS